MKRNGNLQNNMKKAVFLDRDGVLNKVVYNYETKEFEAPHELRYLELMDGTISNLKKLNELDFLIFLVSNQPDYAKGKITLNKLIRIEGKFKRLLENNNVLLNEYYYCHHHPEGIVLSHSIECKCRKPGTFFIEEAKRKYNINLSASWMIGDQDSDIFCGQKAGTKTILIENLHSNSKRGQSFPDFTVKNLTEAINIINNS